MIKTFAIFKERYASLQDDGMIAHYRAVPEDHLLTGIFDPRYDVRIEPDVLDKIDAKTPAEAVELYRLKVEEEAAY
ncbi:hypothetical protein BH09SUM1_BH09SUM1_33990 [soil metagenome]